MRLRSVRPGFALTVALALTACGDDDPVRPVTRALVTGSYVAVAFTVTDAGGTRNLIAEGAAVSLALSSDGTTSGRLFVPGGAEGGGDLDADLAGSWSLDPVTASVTLDHDADTFLRDMTLTYEDGRLVGAETFAGAEIRVTLEKG